MTSTASPNATSSPGSADGPSQPGLPGFPLIAPSGPDPARVSRSRSPAKAPVSTIHGTCGPTSFASSPPVGPLSSWESRLRARLAMVGSTECSLIWRVKATPAGGSISRLAPWTPPISASGSTGSQSEEASAWRTPQHREKGGGSYSDPEKAMARLSSGHQINLQDEMVVAAGWPTPQARDGMPAHTPEYVAKHKANGHGMSNLNDHMAFTAGAWPTPAAADLSGGRSNPAGTSATGQRPDGTKAQVGLPNVMKEASTRSTPRASDGEKGGPNQSFGAGGQPLPAQMHHAEGSPWATPRAEAARARGNPMHLGGRRGAGNIEDQVMAAAMHSASPWVTPSARDYKDSAGMTSEREDGRSRIDQLPRQMAASKGSGPDTTGSSATTARPAGSPNPAFPCWLMGFPTVWLSGADSAMPSSRNSRRK